MQSKYTEGLQNIEVLKKETFGRPSDNSAIEEQNGLTTFGPVHFVKELKQVGFGGKRQSVVNSDLDENLRGKVERFQIAASPHQEHNKISIINKERQQHAQKYSKQVNDLNRKGNSRSPSPSFGRGPKSKFDPQSYKKQLQRKLMAEMRDEETQRMAKIQETRSP